MITVITPYWNAMPWLERCCESLHRQDGDFEFVLVDDSSTDNGADVAKQYAEKDSRFTTFLNIHQRGVSGARNTGLDHAHGEWVTFLDADDIMLPDAYRTFKRVIDMAPDATMHQLNHERDGSTIHKYTNKRDWYQLPDLPLTWWGVWNTLYRADLVADIRFDESIQYGEDGLFNLECLAVDGRIHHGRRDMVAVNHRFDNSESLSHTKKPEDVLKQIRVYEDFLMRSDNPVMRAFMCRELSRLWGKRTIERLFSGI